MRERPPIDWNKYRLDNDPDERTISITGNPMAAEELFRQVYRRSDITYIGEYHGSPGVDNFKGRVIKQNDPDLIPVEGINVRDQGKVDRNRGDYHFRQTIYDRAIMSVHGRIIATDSKVDKFAAQDDKLVEFGQLVETARIFDRLARGEKYAVTKKDIPDHWQEIIAEARANPKLCRIEGDKITYEGGKLTAAERGEYGKLADRLLHEADKIRPAVAGDLMARDGDSPSNRTAAKTVAEVYAQTQRQIGHVPKTIMIYGADHYKRGNDIDELIDRDLQRKGLHATSAIVNIVPVSDPHLIGKAFQNVAGPDSHRPEYTVFVDAKDSQFKVHTHIQHDRNYRPLQLPVAEREAQQQAAVIARDMARNKVHQVGPDIPDHSAPRKGQPPQARKTGEHVLGQ